MAIDNASAKIEGYARNFADNALRDIMWQILRLLVANKDSPSVQQLSMSVSGQPFILGELGIMNIMDKSDIVAKVGLGHQTGQQKIAATQNILELVAQLEAAPSQTLYRLTEETLKGWGYENPGLILQPLEIYMQKAQEAMMMQQQALQLQQQQAQMQAMQIQSQMQQAQAEMALKEQAQRFEQQVKSQELMAKISEIMAKADLTDAQKEQQIAETIKFLESFDTLIQSERSSFSVYS